MKTLRYLEETIQLALDDKRCIGCGNCVTVCPHRVFSLHGKKAQVRDRGGCMECGACARNCPVEAILVNSREGCGCATLIIKSWLSKATGRKVEGGGCC